MCGRFPQTQSSGTIAAAFQLSVLPQLEPRYNIAPTQAVAAVLQTLDSQQRQCKFLRWGLIPSWAKDPAIGSRLINARAETASEKPSFRAAFKKRRCLILADGFYEWQRQEGGKQPFYFQLQHGVPFAFAGLWESWRGDGEGAIASCTILTTTANSFMQPYHHRMPVILNPTDYDRWLDPALQTPAQLQTLLCPYPPEAMTAYPVSKAVNKATHDSPACIRRAAGRKQQAESIEQLSIME